MFSPKKHALLLNLLESKDIISQNHKHIFNRKKFQSLLKRKEQDPIKKACEILELFDSDFNKNAIKKQFKKLAKIYHPDKIYHLQDEKTAFEYTKKFQEIKTAYEILINK